MGYPHRMAGLASAGVIAIGLLAAACGNQGANVAKTGNSSPGVTASPSSGASKSTMLKTEKTSIGTVLATGQGRTVYWFGPDTPTTSKCSGACLTAWPAVKGAPAAASGATIPGKLGEIKRSDGITQATWNGHPLYTYFGDSSAGQTNGNGLNSYGGLWHAVVLSGSGASSSPSPSSGGGGYGGGGY